MDIRELRQEIDLVDADLLALIDRRMQLVLQVAKAKLSQDVPQHDPIREQCMLQAARESKQQTLFPAEAEEFISTLLPITRSWVARRRRGATVPPLRIAVVGLGLIGGSIAKALKLATPGHSLSGVDLEDRLTAPRESGLFEELFAPENGAMAAKNADVVFICTHVEKTLELLPAIADDAPKKATVTDVSGVKRVVAKAADQAFGSPSAAHFVGGHPMAGRALGGFEHSDGQLFEGRPWVLTPTPRDPIEKMRRLSLLIESMGAHVRLLSPEEHDETMPVVSHLPQLVSVALMLTAGGRDRGVAGNSLIEMTRLATSPADLWNRLVARSRPELIGELQRLKSYLTELEMAVSFGESLDKWFDRAKKLRAELMLEEVDGRRGFS